MRIPQLPKKMLVHNIEYLAYTGEKDRYGKEILADPITIKNVRFDDSTIFSRDQTQTKVLANAVVFVDAVNSHPVPEFKERSKIRFNGHEYTVQKVVPCYHPLGNAIHHYELEVI